MPGRGQVVGIVHNAAGRLAHLLHFLGLPETFLGRLDLGQIPYYRSLGERPSRFRIPKYGNVPLYGDHLPVNRWMNLNSPTQEPFSQAVPIIPIT